MIMACAIKTADGQVFVGKCHRDAYIMAMNILQYGPVRGEEGFITTSLEFLNRKEAYKYAKKTGQLRRRDTGNHYAGKELYSEDLW